MPISVRGAIDCDVHPGVPTIKALLPYMDDFWLVLQHHRGMEQVLFLDFVFGIRQ